MIDLENDWNGVIGEEFNKDYYLKLREFLKREYNEKVVYPDMYNIFASLKASSYSDTKVVIVGQDPYHGPNQAHGFSFSVKSGVKIPPSLNNIFKELQEDIGIQPPSHGNLRYWAEQGVLLLNHVLTVRAHEAHSHKGAGWERFTDAVIEALNNRDKPVVFILWGSHAQRKGKEIDRTKHKVITSVHPSPLAAYRGFFGSQPFSKANDFLARTNQTGIDWSLPDPPRDSPN